MGQIILMLERSSLQRPLGDTATCRCKRRNAQNEQFFCFIFLFDKKIFKRKKSNGIKNIFGRKGLAYQNGFIENTSGCLGCVYIVLYGETCRLVNPASGGGGVFYINPHFVLFFQSLSPHPLRSVLANVV